MTLHKTDGFSEDQLHAYETNTVCPSCKEPIIVWCRIELFAKDRQKNPMIFHCCENCFKNVHHFLTSFHVKITKDAFKEYRNKKEHQDPFEET